jgi:hypothetical protein
MGKAGAMHAQKSEDLCVTFQSVSRPFSTKQLLFARLLANTSRSRPTIGSGHYHDFQVQEVEQIV